MKTIVAIFVLALVGCTLAQYASNYNYGYHTYTPGARVSHYASSGLAAPAYPLAYNYGYHGGAYPGRYW